MKRPNDNGIRLCRTYILFISLNYTPNEILGSGYATGLFGDGLSSNLFPLVIRNMFCFTLHQSAVLRSVLIAFRAGDISVIVKTSYELRVRYSFSSLYFT